MSNVFKEVAQEYYEYIGKLDVDDLTWERFSQVMPWLKHQVDLVSENSPMPDKNLLADFVIQLVYVGIDDIFSNWDKASKDDKGHWHTPLITQEIIESVLKQLKDEEVNNLKIFGFCKVNNEWVICKEENKTRVVWR